MSTVLVAPPDLQTPARGRRTLLTWDAPSEEGSWGQDTTQNSGLSQGQPHPWPLGELLK